MKQVHEGIYQLITPFPEYQKNEAYQLRVDLEANPRVTRGLPYVLPYFITSRGDNLLLDAGWSTDEAHEALSEQLETIGSGIPELQKLLITHAHPDHCGLAGRLKQESGCVLGLHELEVDFMRTRYEKLEELLDRLDEWYERWGVPPADREEMERGSMPMRFFVTHAKIDMPLRGGEIFEVGDFALEVVWTPGHSPGHICLYEHNHQILFTGDHILPTITPNVSVHPQQRENPLQDFLNSLKKVASLKVKQMLPAHEWDVKDFSNRIAFLMTHHESRLDDMLDALGKEAPRTPLEVAQAVAWTTGSYDSFPAWMKRAAIGETLSHLVFLEGEGRVKRQEADGIFSFIAA